MILYLSGAIASEPLGPDYARQNFLCWKHNLTSVGYEVLNPYDVPACEDTRKCNFTSSEIVPAKHSWSCYLRYDIFAMLGCDGVAQLPGHQLSPGSTLEEHVAVACGLPVRWAEAWRVDPPK